MRRPDDDHGLRATRRLPRLYHVGQQLIREQAVAPCSDGPRTRDVAVRQDEREPASGAELPLGAGVSCALAELEPLLTGHLLPHEFLRLVRQVSPTDSD
jgi:hypothetical protein